MSGLLTCSAACYPTIEVPPPSGGAVLYFFDEQLIASEAPVFAFNAETDILAFPIDGDLADRFLDPGSVPWVEEGGLPLTNPMILSEDRWVPYFDAVAVQRVAPDLPECLAMGGCPDGLDCRRCGEPPNVAPVTQPTRPDLSDCMACSIERALCPEGELFVIPTGCEALRTYSAEEARALFPELRPVYVATSTDVVDEADAVVFGAPGVVVTEIRIRDGAILGLRAEDVHATAATLLDVQAGHILLRGHSRAVRVRAEDIAARNATVTVEHADTPYLETRSGRGDHFSISAGRLAVFDATATYERVVADVGMGAFSSDVTIVDARASTPLAARGSSVVLSRAVVHGLSIADGNATLSDVVASGAFAFVRAEVSVNRFLLDVGELDQDEMFLADCSAELTDLELTSAFDALGIFGTTATITRLAATVSQSGVALRVAPSFGVPSAVHVRDLTLRGGEEAILMDAGLLTGGGIDVRGSVGGIRTRSATVAEGIDEGRVRLDLVSIREVVEGVRGNASWALNDFIVEDVQIGLLASEATLTNGLFRRCSSAMVVDGFGVPRDWLTNVHFEDNGSDVGCAGPCDLR